MPSEPTAPRSPLEPLTPQQRLEKATQSAEVGIWEWDPAKQQLTWDDRMRSLHGLQEFDGQRETWLRQVHPEDRPAALSALPGLGKESERYVLDYRITRADGGVRHLESRGVLERDAAGRIVRITGTERDVTHLVEASRRNQQLAERLQLALRAGQFGVWELEVATGRVTWDEQMFEIYGLRREDFRGTRDDWLRHIDLADSRIARAAMLTAIEGRSSSYRTSFRIMRPDGALRRIEEYGQLQRDGAGRVQRLVGLDRDVGDAIFPTGADPVAEGRWQLAIQGTDEAVWDWNIPEGTVFHDEQWTRMLGYSPAEIAPSAEAWRKLVHPDDLPATELLAQEHIAQRAPGYQAEYRMRAKAGGWRWILDRGKVVTRDSDGRALRMVGTHTDITARKNLEQRLQRTDALADQVGRLARIGGWEFDPQARRMTWSAEVCRIHEVDEDYVPTLDDARKIFPGGLIEAMEAGVAPATLGAFDHEVPLMTAKGRHIWVRVLGRPEAEPGQPSRFHGALQDLTVQHQTETDRRALEAQLFQAQKMETLGTLSGGIAHDFNNLLTGILGYHELAADSIPEDHPARACLTEARNASLRARELVEQILTFSRQSSEAEHGAVDLRPVIEEGRRFLRATLPANITIEADIDPDCGLVRADGSQIHQVILNLGSNAAHAMRTNGGTLRLAVRQKTIAPEQTARLGGIAPGRYLCLSMSDTGHGMDETTARRIFEPFFTTKNTREGTGLGLAVVHGIVRAHRGAIDVESEVGRGTTFHVYLPLSADEPVAEPAGESATQRGDGELVCIVDDEGLVGRFTKATIEKLGYDAVSFGSAEECLQAWKSDPRPYRVLVTDQTMPGMQGTELATALRKLIPGLHVVIMSGHFSKIYSRELDELGQVELLAKPFTTEQLSGALHRALHPGA